MIVFKHADIEYEFKLDSGSMVDLTIEAPKFYRSFVLDLLGARNENFSLSEDGKSLDYEKTALIIPNLFELDPNNKKVLLAIYKKIDRNSLTPERQVRFDEINAKIASLIDDIATDFEGSVVYNDVLTLPQILGLIDFKFDYDDSTFFSSFVSYIKAWREAFDLKIVFVLNLFSMLNTSEVAALSKELAYSGVCLINISYCRLSDHPQAIKSVVIDKDLCEIY